MVDSYDRYQDWAEVPFPYVVVAVAGTSFADVDPNYLNPNHRTTHSREHKGSGIGSLVLVYMDSMGHLRAFVARVSAPAADNLVAATVANSY